MPDYARTELGVRDMLRTKQPLLSLLNNDTRRIDLTYSLDSKTYIILYRAGGGTTKYVPTDNGNFTFHCYGSSRRSAMDLANALVGVLHGITGEENNGTYLYNAEVTTQYYLPDGDHERYVVSALIRARAGVA